MKRVLPLVAALALAGCGKPDPVADQANNTANLVEVVDEANAVANAARNESGQSPAAAQSSTPTASPTGAPPSAPLTGAGPIPSALHGRWGLTPGDCTTTLGDAKGLLIVSGDELRFYESRAVPRENVSATADTLSAEFAFTGEGQTWTKFETLQLKGDKLIRTESNPMASFTYARCH